MRFSLLIAFFLVSFSHILFSQDSISIKQVKESYESFEYRTVIRRSEQLLQQKDSMPTGQLIELYTMNAVAHFSLSEETEARRAFIEILQLKKDFLLDTASISPKIIVFFEKVKNEYTQITERKQESVVLKKDSVQSSKPFILLPRNDVVQNVVLRSVAVPGWGHLYAKESAKGWLLTATGIVTLGSSIYFAVDANKKEQEYLNETNSNQIDQKYNNYNTSYKMRNVSLVSYALVWTYTQLDVLFFSNDVLIAGVSPSVSYDTSFNPPPAFSFSIKIPL